MFSKRQTGHVLFAGVFLGQALFCQVKVEKKPSPAKIEGQILLGEPVVRTQWAHTLDLVNAPETTTLLNPGQCIRLGLIATGDQRDDYLSKTKLSYQVKFAGHTDSRELAPISSFKKIKPEGGDFVKGALAAAAIKAPDVVLTMASLGVSEARWCAPLDSPDGVAEVEAIIEPPDARRIHATVTVSVETFATGAKKSFKDMEECGAFVQTYYRHPNPARLLPAMEFLMAEESAHPQPGHAEITSAFLSAALKSDPAAAQFMLSRIGSEPPLTRALGLLALRSAGYEIGPILNGLSQEEQKKFQSVPPLEDAFDFTPTQALFNHLDMLWSVFGATGDYEPVMAISRALAWRADYDAFVKLKGQANGRRELTPEIVRGVVYRAAGWSLGSFQNNDPLVADYIDYMLASQDTPTEIKSELRGLLTNPAFRR